MANINLLESYKGRLVVSESVYAREHNGEKLSQNKKMVIAKLLDNQNKFLNEAFDNSVGTQKADMGLFKKFTLNLTTAAIPNLIAFDLVMVHPMTAMSGYVSYVEYVAGSNKGDTKQGDVFNSPFGLGKVDPNYTSSKVVETIDTVGATVDHVLGWTPIAGSVMVLVGGAWVAVADEHLVKDEKGAVTGISKSAFADGTRVKYEYDNVVIPQHDLPIVNARMKSIALEAKARRIAIYYSKRVA